MVKVNGLPAGSVLDNRKLTVRGTSDSDPLLNSTVHDTVTLDPTGRTGFDLLLVRITDVGIGTAVQNTNFIYHAMSHCPSICALPVGL